MTEERGMLVLRITAVVLLSIGVFLAAGGAWLVALGGSPYYIVAGGLITASGALLWLRNGWGGTIFELTATATLLWAVWESGWDGWALFPRIGLPLLLAAWLFTPWVRRPLHHDPDAEAERGHSVKGAAAGIAIAFLAGAVGFGASQLKAAEGTDAHDAPVNGDWLYTGDDLGGSHYSQLAQINENNVGQLTRAWQYRTGVSPATSGAQTLSFDATPIEIDDTLYLCTPNSVVIALNAETGGERWRFDPHTRTEGPNTISCRGVAYHARAGADGVCAKRIIAATVDARLFAVDAATGKPCADFGGRGVLSLLEGLGEVLPGSFAMTAPPLVVGERLIVGGWVKFKNAPNETFGYVRAFDAGSGKRLWTWDMGRTNQGARRIPQAPEPWSGFVADEALGQLYLGTGNDIPDFTDGKRTSYGSSVVALDLGTGKPKWSFQTVHGDRWNSDLAAPVLVDLQTIDGKVPALVQATKQGQIFVLDRRSGKSMVDVTERAAPKGAAGDAIAATQPVSKLSLLPPPLTETDMWGLTPLDQLVCRIRFKSARYSGAFTPPGGGSSISYPGHQGLIGSGGVAVDQVNKLVVAPVSMIASYVSADGTSRPFIGPLSVPCNEPPWGLLHLVDLKTDKHAWGLPIGSFRNMGPFGLPSMLPMTVGAPNLGGPLVTRGALIFHSGTADNTLRAYNLFTGQELWSAGLPAGGQAAPMTYTTRSGKQFVVVAAGGSGALGTSAGDYVVAYALP